MILIRIISLIVLLCPAGLSAIRITEIMYDTPGSDTGREWIEVYNDTDHVLDLSNYRLKEEGVDHEISSADPQVSLILDPQSYVVIASNVPKFLADWPATPRVLKSSFSLKNTGEILELITNGKTEDSVSYNSDQGAEGDGNSIQLIGSVWKANVASPAKENQLAATVPSVISVASSTYDTNPRGSPETEPAVAAGDRKQKIYARSTVKTQGLYGVPHQFRGQAFNEKNEVIPPTQIRFLWVFGDGQVGEGQNITHQYRLPGRYTAVLAVSLGEHTASEYVSLEIQEPVLSLVLDEEGRWLEIHNTNAYDIDLSSWILRPKISITEKREQFFFPPFSIIRAGQYMKLASTTAQFSFMFGVILLYPNEMPMTTADMPIMSSKSPAEIPIQVSPPVQSVRLPMPVTQPDEQDIERVATTSELAFATYIAQENTKNKKEFNLSILLWIATIILIVGTFFAARHLVGK